MSVTLRSALASLVLTSSALAADCPKDALSSPAEGTTCACPTAGLMDGWVYGTGRYTADSYPCTAAVHDGKITSSGGDITFYTGGSCPAFASTTANGVTSSGWGKFDQTFAFETPLPDCALQQAAGASASAPPAATPTPAPAATPAAAPEGAEPGPEDWQKRADTYYAAVPPALKGWTGVDRPGEWSNSGMSGYSVTGGRIYKFDGPSMLHDLTIFVYGTPDGTPYPRFETIWTGASAKTTVAGREAVRVEEAGSGEIMIVFRNPEGVYMVIGRLASHETTDAEMEAYAAAIDFKKFDALKVK